MKQEEKDNLIRLRKIIKYILVGLLTCLILLISYSIYDRAMCEEDKSVKVSCSGFGCDGIDPVTGEFFKWGETCKEFRTLFIKGTKE